MTQQYKHKVVQGLSDLIEAFGGKGKDPFMNAVWFGIKGQVPLLLKTLDENPGAVAEIEKKLLEVLDIEPEPAKGVALLETPQPATEEDKPVAEVQIDIVPAAGDVDGDNTSKATGEVEPPAETEDSSGNKID